MWPVNDQSLVSPDFTEFGEFQKSISKIVRCLRLSGAGDVEAPGIFGLILPDKKAASKTGWRATRHGGRTFSLKAEDIDRFKSLYAQTLSDDWAFVLALSNFESAYGIEDQSSRFLMFVTALESIFNRGRDQIAHTLARHLSLILSQDRPGVDDWYRRIKALYGKRSALVHGTVTTVFPADVYEAEELARRALVYCIQRGGTKAELFDFLNACGYV